MDLWGNRSKSPFSVCQMGVEEGWHRLYRQTITNVIQLCYTNVIMIAKETQQLRLLKTDSPFLKQASHSTL